MTIKARPQLSILFDILGIDVSGDALTAKPNLISGITKLELKNVTFRNNLYDIIADENGNVSIISI